MPWCASSPHHITSIFYPVYTSKPETTGSLGIGLAVEPRLIACMPGNEEPITSTAMRALAILQSADYRGIWSAPLPPGKGYAVSAASAIAASLASVKWDGRKTGFYEALQAAHKAELLESSGLGDVLSISCGVGVVIRLQPGAPGIGKVECFPLPRSIALIAVEPSERSMHTERLLKSYREPEPGMALRLIRRVAEEGSLEAFVESSRLFTDTSRSLELALGEAVARTIRGLPGLVGYYAKKLVAVAMVEMDWALDALETLKQLSGITIRILAPSEHGPRVWWEYGA